MKRTLIAVGAVAAVMAVAIVIALLTTGQRPAATQPEPQAAENPPPRPLPSGATPKRLPGLESAPHRLVPSEAPQSAAGQPGLSAALERLPGLLSPPNTLIQMNDGSNPVPTSIHSSQIPPENGAHFFVLASELLPNVDRAWLREQWREVLANGWSDNPQLIAYLEACAPALDAIRMGLETGNILMPFESTPYAPTEWPSLQADFNALVMTMIIQGRMYATQDDPAAAFETHRMAMDFAIGAQQGAGFSGALTAYGMTTLTSQTLRNALVQGELGAEFGTALVNQAAAADERLATTSDAIRAEAAMWASWTSPENPNATDILTLMTRAFGTAPGNEECMDYLAGFPEPGRRQLFNQALAYAEALAQASAAGPEAVQQVMADASANPVSAIMLNHLQALTWNEARTRTELRGAFLTAGLEMYQAQQGAPPATLEDLVPGYLPGLPADPFTGGPFLYAPAGGSEGGSYMLYSPGADLEDDGGTTAQGGLPIDGDIVIHAP